MEGSIDSKESIVGDGNGGDRNKCAESFRHIGIAASGYLPRTQQNAFLSQSPVTNHIDGYIEFQPLRCSGRCRSTALALFSHSYYHLPTGACLFLMPGHRIGQMGTWSSSASILRVGHDYTRRQTRTRAFKPHSGLTDHAWVCSS